eukprot:8448190-Alexandrium_andersonii.AAC.1
MPLAALCSRRALRRASRAATISWGAASRAAQIAPQQHDDASGAEPGAQTRCQRARGLAGRELIPSRSALARGDLAPRAAYRARSRGCRWVRREHQRASFAGG